MSKKSQWKPKADYYLPGAEPFFFPGGPTGCLLLHGLASSPGEMRWLGEHLAQQGHAVHGVRLAGHGADYHDLARVHWRDWYGSLLDAWHVLSAQCEQIVLVGHSTGGTLALLAGAELPVSAVAALAAPVQMDGWWIRNSWWLRYVLRYVDAADTSDLPDRVRVEQQRRGEPEYGRVRYDRWASNGPHQLYQLARQTRARLPALSVPLLLLYARHDSVVDAENSTIIRQAAGSAIIESQWVETGGHNLMIDEGRETVFSQVADFIGRYSGQEQGS